MDPITHYMIAYVFGREMGLQKPQLKALTLSAMLPDIDVFTIVFGWDIFVRFHGTITHSIPIGLLLSLILSLIFRLYYGEKVFVYALIGISMHLILDLIPTLMPVWSHEGMILLFPFSPTRFALRGMVPHSMVIGGLLVGSLFLGSLYFLIRFVRRKEYPWRIWIDERRITGALKRIISRE